MIETEIKFAVDRTTAHQVIYSKFLKRAKTSTKRVVSTYFDTPQHLLRQSEASLRVRDKAGKLEQTIKIRADGVPGMQNFEEITLPLERPEPDLMAFDRALLKRLASRPGNLNVQPVFTTDVERTTANLSRGKTKFEIAIDIGSVTNHSGTYRKQDICEIEFELVKGDPAVMLGAALELAESHELRPAYLTKAQRGYALARPSLRPRFRKANKVKLNPDLSVGDSFLTIVSEALSHLHDNHQPTLDGDPGGIHQSRVAIRRIRAALRAFKKVLPYDKRKAFNGEFRWLQQRLAPARDWHVFMDETLANIAGDFPAASAEVSKLRRYALNERRRTMTESAELLVSRRYTRLLLNFQRWLIELEDNHPDVFSAPLLPFAESVLAKTRRDFLQDPKPLSRYNPDELHEVRKRGKKARYATEFFAFLWTGPDVAPYLKTMEKIQDQLGYANDAFVARHLLALIPPRSLDADSIMLVNHWSENQIKVCIRKAQPNWRKFQRARPFWEVPPAVQAPVSKPS